MYRTLLTIQIPFVGDNVRIQLMEVAVKGHLQKDMYLVRFRKKRCKEKQEKIEKITYESTDEDPRESHKTETDFDDCKRGDARINHNNCQKSVWYESSYISWHYIA